MHVNVVAEAASAKRQKDAKGAKRPGASPGTLVSGTVLHVLADHATVQLDNGESRGSECSYTHTHSSESF